jgi:hypothetical protein
MHVVPIMEQNLHGCFNFISLMKNYMIVTVLFVVMATACKTKKSGSSASAAKSTTTTTTTLTEPASQAPITGSTMGTVSHKYRKTGCSTVILVKQDDNEITLIPKDKLASQFDVDGMVILFNYHTLRMPQPEGCTTGQPAEVTDISKK